MKATLFLVALGALGGLGCSSTPASPFNQMQTSQVMVFRLQNYEPPAQPTPTPAVPGMGGIPGLPPELTQWLGGGAGGLPIPPQLCQMAMGMPLPGCTGAATPGATPAPAANAPRFQNFRIINQAPLMDEDGKKELAKALGTDSNFDSNGSACMYPDYGIGFSPNNEMLISFGCKNVEARTFAWPHPNRNMKKDTSDKLIEIFKKLNILHDGL